MRQLDRVPVPQLASLDECLEREAVDYVGTRLHAGIRAMQKGRRSLIIGIDNRAIEMGTDFNLPVVRRDDVAKSLQGRIDGSWETHIRLDHQAIRTWRGQFVAQG